MSQRNFIILAVYIFWLLQIFAISCERTHILDSVFIDDLTNADIDMALSDLTLSDLNALSELIDTEKDMYYDYANSHILENPAKNNDAYDYTPPQFKNLADKNKMYSRDLNYPNLLPQGEVENFNEVNQRSKREYIKKPKPNDEYLKQLQDSFPRDVEEYLFNRLYKNIQHVRVKRN